MKKISVAKFYKMSEEKREEYLEKLQDEVTSLYAEADDIMAHIWELDEQTGAETQEWLNERPGI